MQSISLAFIIGIFFALLVTATPVFAQSLGPAQTQLINLVYKVANFLGTIFLITATAMFLYTGYLYWTAQGNAQKIQQVNQTLLWAVIGTAVGLLAFVAPTIIQNFIGQ